MPFPTYTLTGPSVIVNGVCSSVYVDDYVTHYCERGEEGPHSLHSVGVRQHSLTWSDFSVCAYNDERVLRLEPK